MADSKLKFFKNLHELVYDAYLGGFTLDTNGLYIITARLAANQSTMVTLYRNGQGYNVGQITQPDNAIAFAPAITSLGMAGDVLTASNSYEVHCYQFY